MKLNITLFLLSVFMIASCSQKTYNKEILPSKLLESGEIRIETEDSIFISGSLEYATKKNLVVFIAGSGPTDRNCNNNAGLHTDAFKMLALYLKEEGVSTFRFDKRGVGKSTTVEESEVVFDSFVNDVSKIVEYFKNDFDDIILLGHSEGALIGSMVSKSKNISAFISVSGNSKSLDKIVLDQLAKYP